MSQITGLTSGRYVRHWLDLMSRRGYSVAELFSGTGLDIKQFDNPPSYLSQLQVERIFENALKMTNNQYLGIEFGMNLNFAAHGPLGFAGLTARTVLEAQEQMVRYMPLVTSLVRLAQTKDVASNSSVVQVLPQPGISPITANILTQTVLSSVYVMTRFLLGEHADIRICWTQEPSDYITNAFKHPSTTTLFNHTENSFGIPISLVDTPVVLADEHARQQAIASCESEMRELEKHTTLSHRIHRQLLDNSNGMPSIEQIAKQLHLSTRTVHRRLQEEGTCFRDLANSVRMTLAKQYLIYDGFSVTEVAYRLGYGDSANFTRAFKRAEKLTPTEYLQQNKR